MQSPTVDPLKSLPAADAALASSAMAAMSAAAPTLQDP
jgi:hypothetical protein